MKRSSAIATSATVAAVLAAACMAGYAIFEAASTSSPANSREIIVATTSPESPVLALPAPADSQNPAGSLSVAPAAPQTSTVAREAVATTVAAPPKSISRQAATAKVKAQVEGALVSAVPVRHQGFDAWKVVIAANDGSTATAWVDKASGVVYDWKVIPATLPPTPAPSAQTQENENEQEYEQEEEHEDEQEYEDEDEGSDDDD